MSSKRNVTLVVVGIVTVVVIGILATVIGKVGVRRVQPSTTIVFQVQEPVVLGVPTVVRWTLEAGMTNRAVDLRLRDAGGTYPLASSALDDGTVTVVFPCASRGTSGSLQMFDGITEELLARSVVAILPAGQDCF